LRRRVAGVGLILGGLAGVLLAGWVFIDAWSTRANWDASAEAQALEAQAAEPTPIWLAPATPEPVVATIVPLPTAAIAHSTATADRTAEPVAAVSQVSGTPEPQAPAPFALGVAEPAAPAPVTTDDLSLDRTDFRFLDPPEPGSHARLAFSVTNRAPATSGRILLGIPAKWFDSFHIIGTAPAVSSDRTDDSGLRVFSFPPILGRSTATYELHVTAIEEVTSAPSVKVMLDADDVVGEDDKPATYAPPPRPGPVMAISIPRLELKSGVVQIAWEPPPFAVGQIKGTANITTGNTVLVGHLTGNAGNVFAKLDELMPGDEITATSRGLPYSFVVSRVFQSANDDAKPMAPADDARLTLMTCAGIWNPLTHDYSERLWVIAEPPDQAKITIANAHATATAYAPTAVAATRTAIALIPTPTTVPTPYAGEPALPGGIGNTRPNLERAFGQATGETSGKLVVFHQPDREVRVAFSPDPQRAQFVAVFPTTPFTFDAAVHESRLYFPHDASPRSQAPEGNAQFIVERFTSPSLGQALGNTDFSVIYARDGTGMITSIVLGPGDDFDALQARAKR
jgi:sortase (surface protein transpeptidase)